MAQDPECDYTTELVTTEKSLHEKWEFFSFRKEKNGGNE